MNGQTIDKSVYSTQTTDGRIRIGKEREREKKKECVDGWMEGVCRRERAKERNYFGLRKSRRAQKGKVDGARGFAARKLLALAGSGLMLALAGQAGGGRALVAILGSQSVTRVHIAQCLLTYYIRTQITLPKYTEGPLRLAHLLQKVSLAY